MGHRQHTHAPNSSLSFCANASSLSFLRAVMMSLQPSSASLSAVAYPMPLEAPVMRAQRPATGVGAYSLLTPGAGGTCVSPDMAMVSLLSSVAGEANEAEPDDGDDDVLFAAAVVLENPTPAY